MRVIFPFLAFGFIVFFIQALPVLIVSVAVLSFRKIKSKINFKSEFKKLLPFYLVLTSCYFIIASMWDGFIESKSRQSLFYYWDQIPFGGFNLFSHDRPATRGLSTDLAPGVNLLTLDLIWIGLLIVLYVATFLITWYLFWRNKKQSAFISAFIIVLVLFIWAILVGFNKRGLVL